MTGPTTTQAAADSAQENAEAAEEETAEKEQAADAAKDEAKEKNQELMQAAASGSAKATATKGGGAFGQLNKEAVDIAKELGKLQRAYLDEALSSISYQRALWSLERQEKRLIIMRLRSLSRTCILPLKN